MRISDWSSDVCSSDLDGRDRFCRCADPQGGGVAARPLSGVARLRHGPDLPDRPAQSRRRNPCPPCREHPDRLTARGIPRRRNRTMQSENRIFDDFAKMINGIAGTVAGAGREAEAAMRERAKEWVGRMDFVSREEFEAVKRSEEHTSELQSLMRISYAVFCLTKKTYTIFDC